LKGEERSIHSKQKTMQRCVARVVREWLEILYHLCVVPRLWVGEWWEWVLFIEQRIFPSSIAPRDVENITTAPLGHVIRGEKIEWARG
jgi:hypothetical protein